MRLVVGLGNPGNEFVGTRHNVGWEILDSLAVRLHWIGQGRDFNRVARKKFDGLALDGSSPAGNKALLLKPTTFMNASGQAVQAAMAFYQLSPADVMIVLDDMALPCGKIRIRGGGSSGGHNGLKDIERALATDQYPRLRLGIDSPPPPMAGHDYVLGRFTAAQRPVIDEASRRAAEAIVAWIDQGLETAMNGFNKERLKDQKGD